MDQILLYLLCALGSFIWGLIISWAMYSSGKAKLGSLVVQDSDEGEAPYIFLEIRPEDMERLYAKAVDIIELEVKYNSLTRN